MGIFIALSQVDDGPELIGARLLDEEHWDCVPNACNLPAPGVEVSSALFSPLWSQRFWTVRRPPGVYFPFVNQWD